MPVRSLEFVKKLFQWSCITLIGFVVFSCSQSQESASVFWIKQKNTKPPEIKAEHLAVESVNQVGHEYVQIEKQTLEGVPVESSFIKRVYDLEKNPLFVSGKYETEFSYRLKRRVTKLKNISETELASKCLKDKNLFKDKKQMGPARLSVRRLKHKLEPVIKVDLVSKDQLIQTLICNDAFEIVAVESAGSGFTSVKALVYPEGPKKTSLSTVFLKVSETEMNEGLSGDQIVVSTESPYKISTAESLQFSPPDEKFDQVQVYYYLQKAIAWFEAKNLIEKNRLHLSALLHVGYPEKTNAAFYYRGLIRLGVGDDEVFAKMAQDPSIVIHESCHGLIEALAQLPYQGEGGSLNEGFADTLTTIMLGNSKLGEVAYKKGSFKRDVQNKIKFSERNGGLYHDSAIVSSYFWSLKEKLTEENLMNLIQRVLNRMTPFSTLDEYKAILKDEIPKDLSADEETFALNQLNTWE